MDWIGLHIYYKGNIGLLTKNCIIPLLDGLKSSHHIHSFFFILYNEKGTHLRLRLKAANDDEFVINTAKEKINLYIEEFPSSDSDRPVDFFPNNSIQQILYEPEYKRYGGKVGMEISEKQFMYSSEAALSYIRNDGSYKYNSLLNIAIKLHLSSAMVFCENDMEKMILFFNFLFISYTSPVSFPHLKSNFNIEPAYSSIFNQQKEILVPFITSLLDSISKNEPIDKSIDMQLWLKHETEIHGLLNDAYRSNKLELPDLFENKPLWHILHSYFHMTNNRMAIAVIDEPLIAYLIMRSLKHIQ